MSVWECGLSHKKTGVLTRLINFGANRFARLHTFAKLESL